MSVLANRWKTRLLSTVGVTAASLAAALSPLAATASSAASTAPPFEPDTNAAPPYGNVVLYDSAGNEVTSGTNLASPFSYVAATTAADSASIKAIVNFYNPQHGVLPANWTGTAEGAATAFKPLAATNPADLVALTTGATIYPVAKTTADISTWLGSNTPDTTAGYANTIQVRLTETSGETPGTYWESDIGYNTTAAPITVDGTTVPANGWALLFPFVSASTTTITSPANGGSATSGTPVTISATVTPGSAAGGVNFYDNGTFLSNVTTPGSGTYTLTTTPAVGSHSYTASFIAGDAPGDPTSPNTTSATIVGGSTSSAVGFTINPSAQSTTTMVTGSAPASPVTNQPVTYTVNVSPTPNGGTVAFSENGTAISACQAQAVSTTTGNATCQDTLPAANSPYTITATYSGTTAFGGSSTQSPQFMQTIGKAGTTTTLASSPPSPVSQNANVTLTATVASNTPGAVVPSGSVAFMNGAAPISCSGGNQTLTTVSGQQEATCITSFSTPGAQSLSAVYSSDSNFAATTNGTLSLTVNPPTTTAVTSSLNPSAISVPVTYTATVTSPGGPVNAGTVSFTDNGTAIACTNAGGQAVTGGSATCAYTPASVGSHAIVATYSGSASLGSSSGTLTPAQQVNAASTMVAAPTGPATAPVTGQPATFTATVTANPATAGSPAGTVAFSVDGTKIVCSGGNQTVTSGMATCITALTAVGSPHSITAAFTSTSSNFANSAASPALMQTVNMASSSTTLTSSHNPAITGQAVTYTATVAASGGGSGTPTGTVTFLDPGTPIACSGGNQTLSGGKATCIVTYTSAGSHPITATYNADGNFTGSTSNTLTETIEAVTVSSAPGAVSAVSEPGKVILHWTAPASNGNSPIMGYNVYAGTTPGGESSTPINKALITRTSATITIGKSGMLSAASGTKYYFIVKAVNAAGTSNASPEVSAILNKIVGYWLTGTDGGVYAFNMPFHGSLGAVRLNKPIFTMAATSDAGGYWLVASDGGVFAFGDAKFYGSLGNVHLVSPIVGMVATPDGHGYWLVAGDGGVFAFGDAKFLGSLGNVHLAKPIVTMAATADGHGYWLVASDGGVFTFGDAKFLGSLGNVHLVKPIEGMAATADGRGYTLVASDGGVFTFGDAKFLGSLGKVHLAAPIVALVVTQDAGGYWLVASDGGIFTFGDATYEGSVPGLHVSVNNIVGGAS